MASLLDERPRAAVQHSITQNILSRTSYGCQFQFDLVMQLCLRVFSVLHLVYATSSQTEGHQFLSPTRNGIRDGLALNSPNRPTYRINGVVAAVSTPFDSGTASTPKFLLHAGEPTKLSCEAMDDNQALQLRADAITADRIGDSVNRGISEAKTGLDSNELNTLLDDLLRQVDRGKASYDDCQLLLRQVHAQNILSFIAQWFPIAVLSRCVLSKWSRTCQLTGLPHAKLIGHCRFDGGFQSVYGYFITSDQEEKCNSFDCGIYLFGSDELRSNSRPGNLQVAKIFFLLPHS